MQSQQQTPPRSRARQRSTNTSEFSPGMLTTIITIAAVVVLVTATFVVDMLRTPEIALYDTSALISPNGDQDQDQATFNYRLSEDAAVSAYILSGRGGVVRTLMLDQPQAAGQYTLTWDGLGESLQPIEDGSYQLRLTASGTLRASNQTAAITVDTTAPTVELVNLPENLRVRTESITIQGVTDPGAVLRLLDSPQPVAVDGRGYFSFVFRLREGDNFFTLQATDPAGNTNIVQRSIARITTPPEITLASPVDGTWTNQKIVAVSGVASAALYPIPGFLQINGERVNIGADGRFFHQAIVQEGDNLIRVVATDDVGNQTLSEVLVHVKTTAPTIALNITEGETFSSPILQLNGRTDPGSLVTVNGQGVVVGTSGSFQIGLQLLEGRNLVDIVARDLAGNTAALSRQVVYQPPGAASGIQQAWDNLAVLPSLALPMLLAGVVLVLFFVLRQRGIALSLSVDQPTFHPGLPGEGKVLRVWLDMNQTAPVTLEVLDQGGYRVATLLHNRRRTARKHTFTWDGYDDFGRPAAPGLYTIQAEAGINPVKVSSSVQVAIVEDILVHRRAAARGIQTGQRLNP